MCYCDPIPLACSYPCPRDLRNRHFVVDDPRSRVLLLHLLLLVSDPRSHDEDVPPRHRRRDGRCDDHRNRCSDEQGLVSQKMTTTTKKMNVTVCTSSTELCVFCTLRLAVSNIYADRTISNERLIQHEQQRRGKEEQQSADMNVSKCDETAGR